MISGVGIDIIEVERLESMIARWHDRFLNKVFTLEEIAHCEARSNRAASYAARFAAKEAFAKALGTGWNLEFTWKDFSVRNDTSGKPIPVLSPRMKERLKQTRINLSLSHTEHYATAMVIFESE